MVIVSACSTDDNRRLIRLGQNGNEEIEQNEQDDEYVEKEERWSEYWLNFLHSTHVIIPGTYPKHRVTTETSKSLQHN